ncbi:RNA-binding protein [Candidatus Microgenomates bacterium]|nr:MAG: RNA-binding protein [Candidatus Microgenomates bacterium]
MAKRLFVGGLPYSTTNEQLQELFGQVGAIESVNVITDRYTGQGKGFAFVEMANEADAKAAIEKLNGHNLEGRTIVVNEARPQEDRGGSGGGFRGRQGGGGGHGGFNRNRR